SSMIFDNSQIFPVLKSLGVPNLIPPAGNCSDNTQKCASTAYCFKLTTILRGENGTGVFRWCLTVVRCDINAVAGTNVAYQLNKCVKYNEVTVNGYKLTQKICACNKNNLCSGSSPSHAFFTIIVMLIVSL
ncbi:hypothetical protein PENTCL1PPCAC_15773, partial [Pristionchus entomophagus]